MHPPHGLRNSRRRHRFHPTFQRLEPRELLSLTSTNSEPASTQPNASNTNYVFSENNSQPVYADSQPHYLFNPAPYARTNGSDGSEVNFTNTYQFLYSRTDFLNPDGSPAPSSYSTGGNVDGLAVEPEQSNGTTGPSPGVMATYYSKYYPNNGSVNTYGEPIHATIGNAGSHGTAKILEYTYPQVDPIPANSFGNQRSGYQSHSFYWLYTPDANFQGTDVFDFTVTDRLGNSKQIFVDVSVSDSNLGVNFNPSNQTNQEGDDVNIQLPEFDQHQNVLDYTFQNLPPGLSYNPQDGSISGNLDAGDSTSSPYQVSVTASNGYGPANTTAYFTWSVTPASPTIENADDPEWADLNDAEGQIVSMPIIGSDPDDLPLTYSATGLPPGLSIDGSTGIISGTVAAGADTGTDYDVTVTVTNGRSDPDTFEFSWTITQLALMPPGDLFDVTGDTINLPVQVGNPRGGTPNFSADDLPDGLSIDPSTGIISGMIAASAASGMPWLVTIDVTDGTETAEHTFNWTVWPGNPTVTVQDGGFESPAVGPGNYLYGPANSAWTFTGAAGLTGNGSAFATSGQDAPQGQQAAFIQGAGSSISQKILNWGAGSYHVTFAASQRYNSSQDFEVLIDGTVVATFQPGTGSRYLYYTTPAFRVAAGDHTLTFQGADTQGGDNTVLIDGTDIIPATAGVPVINDPSFEQAAVGSGGYLYNPDDSYWDFEGQAGVSDNGTAFTVNNPNTPTGDRVGFLQGTGSFIQAVTDWSSGTYHVSFVAAQRGYVNSPAGEDLQVLLDGVVVGTFTPSGSSYQTYTTPDFTVTAGTHSLAFRGLDTAGGDNTAFLDDVTVTPAGGNSAPTSGSAGLPAITLANPGPQTNYTDDVIDLPVQAGSSGDDTFYYTATGLPAGLYIDPDTGVISGMDDDFDAADGTTYQVTVTVTDEYGQTSTQSFTWKFNADSTAISGNATEEDGGAGSVEADAGGMPVSGQHPMTESRNDNFSNDDFWQNVEKLPGGQAAENWLASQNGQVNWGWTLSVTHGRWETQPDGSIVPVVHIPSSDNEAVAATALVDNITQAWVFGFAAYSKIPTNGDPADWQSYIKERTKAIGQVVTTGAELYLSGASIANEGIDWVITLRDISKADSVSGAAVAALGFLPFVTNSTIKIINQGKTLATITSSQRQLVNNFAQEYSKVCSFGIIGRVKASGTIDDNLRLAYVRIARSPAFINNLTIYNKLAKFLGQQPAASLDEIIKVLGNDVTFAKVSSNVLAAVFAKGDKGYLGPRPTMYYIQGNLSSFYGARAARHELVHLGAAINGQTNTLLHEIAVQVATTPETLLILGGTICIGLAGEVYALGGL